MILSSKQNLSNDLTNKEELSRIKLNRKIITGDHDGKKMYVFMHHSMHVVFTLQLWKEQHRTDYFGQ